MISRSSPLRLEGVWLFGDLVKDVPPGKPTKTRIDTGLNAGTEEQRHYARKFHNAMRREKCRPEPVPALGYEISRAPCRFK